MSSSNYRKNGAAGGSVATQSKTTTVFLVRHGRTPTTGKVLPGRSKGLHLSDEGRAQAEAVALRLSELQNPPSAVYASPLERTQETAAPIARALGLRVRTAQGLVECDVGDWTGKDLKALNQTPEWSNVHGWTGAFRFPSGESFAELTTRTINALLALVAKHQGERVVAVSHADSIKAGVAACAGIPLDLFQRLEISPCSISSIAFHPHGTSILCVNALGNLNELG